MVSALCFGVFIRLDYGLVTAWRVRSASFASILADKIIEKHPLILKTGVLETKKTAAAEQQVPGECAHDACASGSSTVRDEEKTRAQV